MIGFSSEPRKLLHCGFSSGFCQVAVDIHCGVDAVVSKNTANDVHRHTRVQQARSDDVSNRVGSNWAAAGFSDSGIG